MSQPLSDVKIVDTTAVLAGPFCTMLLGDLGAEVIKIEPIAGDMIRRSPPYINGQSTYYLYGNRNKRSITLNLQKEKGLDILYRLIEDADVFVENYKPSTKHRLKIDYETLKQVNATLIYCSVSGFGQSGPWKDRPGFDQIAQGMSGLMSVTGFPDSVPTRVGVAIGDSIASLFATYGILAALIERQKTGRGQYVDTSLLEGLIAVLGFQAAKYFGNNEAPQPQGNDHASFAPYGAYETRDGYINIAAATEKMWKDLCQVLGLASLVDDDRFNTLEKRVGNKDPLREYLEEKLRLKTTVEWVEILNAAHIACGPIFNLEEVFSNAQVLDREMLAHITHPTYGKIPMIGFPVKSSTDFCQVRQPPPVLGEHTEAVLSDLGFSAEDIEALRDEGVI